MPEYVILGAPIVALVPGMVELLKQAGLPGRWAGAAAIGCALLLATLADVAGLVSPTPAEPLARAATWLLAGVVYGLAGAGLYSQSRVWQDQQTAGDAAE